MKALLFLPFAFLISCATSGGGPIKVDEPKVNPKETTYLTKEVAWRSMADVKKTLGSRAKYSGNTVDLQGNAISGKKIKRGGSQDEDSIPLRVYYDGFTLKNGIIRDIPGGIVVRAKDTTYDKLTFIEIGEDALSNNTDAAPGVTVNNCKFYNDGGDKSLQLNDARDAVITNSFFTGGQTAIRLQESSGKARGVKATLTKNEFKNVPTAVNVSGHTTVTASGNTYENVQEKWNGGDHTKINEK